MNILPEEHKLRSKRQIQAALREYEDRIWHASKMDLLHQIECHGGEVPPEAEFDKIMAQVSRLERKYGETLEFDDFGDLMFIAGKLCALRWCMTGAWDDLGVLREVGWKLEQPDDDDEDYEHSEV